MEVRRASTVWRHHPNAWILVTVLFLLVGAALDGHLVHAADKAAGSRSIAPLVMDAGWSPEGPQTITSSFTFSPGRDLDGKDVLWIAGFGSSKDGPPYIIALTWEGDYTNWFSPWTLRLRAEPGIIPASLVDGKGRMADGEPITEYIDLRDRRLEFGRTYRASMSHNPDDMTVSLLVQNDGNGERVFAATLPLEHRLGALYPFAGAGRVGSDAPPDASWRFDVHEFQAYAGFRLLGPPWALTTDFHVELLRKEADGWGVQVGRNLDANDRLAVRIRWPEEPVPGRFTLQIQGAAEDRSRALADLRWESGERLIEVPPDAIPVGMSHLGLTYATAAGRIDLFERPLHRYYGQIEVTVGPLLQQGQTLHGLVQIKADSDLAPVEWESVLREATLELSLSRSDLQVSHEQHESQVNEARQVRHVEIPLADLKGEPPTIPIQWNAPGGPGRYAVDLTLVGAEGVLLIRRGQGRVQLSATDPLGKEAPKKLIVYELSDHRGLDAYAHVLFVTALQGIVNRERPRLYLSYIHERDGMRRNVDEYWLQKLRADGEWLAEYEIVRTDKLLDLIAYFQDDVDGVVAYDSNVPATSNVATTVAGVENLLPVPWSQSPASLWQNLVVHGPKLPVVRWLVKPDGDSLFTGKGIIPGTDLASSGSAKADAYIWAFTRYLEQAKANPRLLGYFLDSYYLRSPGAEWSHALSNRDYLVSNRGFVFDLSPWADEAPNDDPNQPLGTDRDVLLKILHAAYQQAHGAMIKVLGFVPWAWKYTTAADPNSRHDPVPSEWELIRIASAFNGYVEADAYDPSGIGAMANASVFQHNPLEDLYPQNPMPTPADLKEQEYVNDAGEVVPKRYYAFYVGDYDSPAWLYQVIPSLWDDSARGDLPLSWAFNPNLADRFAPGMVYTRRTRTPNDVFVSGDNGAGYLNPGMLGGVPRPIGGLPSGWDAWVEHNVNYFGQWDLSVTGFLITGSARPLDRDGLRRYKAFSPDGIVFQRDFGIGVHEGVPSIRMTADLTGSVDDAVRLAAFSMRGSADQPRFYVFRTILKSPDWHRRVAEGIARELGEEGVEVVDLRTLMMLVRLSHGNSSRFD